MNPLPHRIAGKLVLITIVTSWILMTSARAQTTLNTVLQEQVLRVGLINDRHHYHVTGEGPTGFDYGYAHGLADYLGVELKVVSFYNEINLYKALINHDIHIAAPRFRYTATSTGRVTNGPVLFTAKLIRLMPENADQPCSALETQQRQVLPYLKETVTAVTGLTWQQSDSADSVTLLSILASQAQSCTILPDTWRSALAGYFPSLQEEQLPDSSINKQWLVRAEDMGLLSSLYEYTHLSRANGSLAMLVAAMLEPEKVVEKPDPRALVEHVNTRYPAVQLAVESTESTLDSAYIAAIDYLLNDWRAAQNEQAKESEKPIARLTQIGRKIDALQAQLPARIQGADRTWFILAAYYLGAEHIDDARQLTIQAGANPDLWVDVKQQLPLLQTDYSTTRAGFANGDQAVAFVDQVRYVAETLTLLMKGT